MCPRVGTTGTGFSAAVKNNTKDKLLKAFDKFFSVLRVDVLYKVVLTLSMDEIPKYDHSNENYQAQRVAT